MSEAVEAVSTEVEDLKPKKLTNKAPQGMTFVVRVMRQGFQVKALSSKVVFSQPDTQ
jgi:hypothetical protein